MKQVLLVFLVCSVLLCACGKKLILPEAKNDIIYTTVGGASVHAGEGYTMTIPEHYVYFSI